MDVFEDLEDVAIETAIEVERRHDVVVMQHRGEPRLVLEHFVEHGIGR